MWGRRRRQPAGLPPQEAASQIDELIGTAFMHSATGVALNDCVSPKPQSSPLKTAENIQHERRNGGRGMGSGPPWRKDAAMV